MRLFHNAILTLALLSTAALAASRSHYVHYADANWENIVGPPPLPGSEQQKSEIATLLELQSQRTPAQEKRCKTEVHADAFSFARVVGSHFDEQDCPVTGELLRSAIYDANAIADHVKRHWNRPRPYVTEPRIEPCVSLEKSPSYPSGHALGSMVRAMILAQIFPEKKDALLALGRQIGYDREIAGVHYPSDVAAGQKLGAAIVRQMLENTAFKKEFEKAQEECMQEVH